MSEVYKVPDPTNKEVIDKLGPEVELTTYKTNAKPELSAKSSCQNTKAEIKAKQIGDNLLIKIICVGDYCGTWSKGVYIRDYLNSGPLNIENTSNRPVLGVDFSLKILHRTCPLTKSDKKIQVQIWDIGEQERFSGMSKIYFKNANGAIVFWGARHGSFRSALKWKKSVKKYTDVPVVLIVDSVVGNRESPLSWIGKGMLVESAKAMDEFCNEHGFTAWFEMTSREAGENSVFGQAVARLLDEIIYQQ